jgi:hypothetical protein
MHLRFKLLGGLIALGLIVACSTTPAAPPLPSLTIDPSEVSVSGLSSGGFMAVQAHVAYSATFKRGAGVVAGGPYYIAAKDPSLMPLAAAWPTAAISRFRRS